MLQNNKVAIIGSGITGLTVAYSLQKNGVSCELFEKKNEPGGSVKTVRQGDWLTEYGPNTILLKDRVIADLLIELGLHVNKLIANPAASKRYIVRDGVLQPLPVSPSSAIGTELFSWRGKMRVLKEPFIKRSYNPDQTIAEFAERRLGAEMLDYAINPFVAGIYANNPENLSLRHTLPAMHRLENQYGSLIIGSLLGMRQRKNEGRISRELISFENGLQQLPDKMASRLNKVYYNTEILKVACENGEWFLASKKNTFGPFSGVVINSPLYMMKQSLFPVSETDFKKMTDVHYPPLSVMHLGFLKEQVLHPLDGFGFLAPEKEKRNILGALFSSTLFPGRAPDGYHLLTVFIGGGRQPEIATLQSEEILDIVLDELNELIGVTGEPVFTDHVYWPKSIPAYHIGYDEVLDTIRKIETMQSGLFLAGNFRHGISVPDCIKNGLELAERIRSVSANKKNDSDT
jgi:oxygen-dependent protoporphyrinogen oxidase